MRSVGWTSLLLAAVGLSACPRPDIAGESTRRSFERSEFLGLRREGSVRVNVVRLRDREFEVQLHDAGVLSGCSFPAREADPGHGVALVPKARCITKLAKDGTPIAFEVHHGLVQVDDRGRYGSISGYVQPDADRAVYDLVFGTTTEGPDGKRDLR